MAAKIDDFPELMTPQNISDYAQLTVDEVVELLEQGALPGVKIGTHWRTPKVALATALGLGKGSTSQSDSLTSSHGGEKLQVLVKRKITELLKSDNTSIILLGDLQNKDYCKKYFDLNFPLLIQYDITKPKEEQGLDAKNYRRYWTNIYPGNFLVCSQWYQRQRPFFEAWLKSQGLNQ
jgi:excisionase family DNA binding protein